jgi:hypothetical protein
MNATDLVCLYNLWREATLAEGRAIENGCWAEVAEQQSHKDQLKRRIVTTTEAWQNRWPETGETAKDYERQFRPIVDEMITLETRNSASLALCREQTRAALAGLDRATGTLRGVQRAYGSGAEPHWTSYS